MFRPLSIFIGTRYTRAKRRNHFISFISMISMLGIALGVAALIYFCAMAVFAYNIFSTRLNRIDGDLEGFGSELIALLVREGRI